MASGSPDIVFPFNPATAEVWFDEQPLRFVSPLTRREQRYRVPGQWRFGYEWRALDHAKAFQIISLLRKQSLAGKFTIYDVARPTPSGLATVVQLANLKVKGASQTGQSLLVDGGPNSLLIFKQGDLIGLANTKQMIEVAADCTTNGSGEATIALCQYLDASPADNEDVVVSYVPCTVFLDGPIRSSIVKPRAYTFRAEFSEAIPN